VILLEYTFFYFILVNKSEWRQNRNLTNLILSRDLPVSIQITGRKKITTINVVILFYFYYFVSIDRCQIKRDDNQQSHRESNTIVFYYFSHLLKKNTHKSYTKNTNKSSAHITVPESRDLKLIGRFKKKKNNYRSIRYRYIPTLYVMEYIARKSWCVFFYLGFVFLKKRTWKKNEFRDDVKN
jgi:hypothetical protein